MAIRIRKVNGRTVALCAAQSIVKEGDIYLDDSMHHALATKFGLDFKTEGIAKESFADPELVKIIEQEHCLSYQNPNFWKDYWNH